MKEITEEGRLILPKTMEHSVVLTLARTLMEQGYTVNDPDCWEDSSSGDWKLVYWK